MRRLLIPTLAVAVLGLAACSETVTATVHSDGTVSGVVRVGVSSMEIADQVSQDSTGATTAASALASDRATMASNLMSALPPGVTGTVSDWSDQGNAGEQLTFTGVSLSDFASMLQTAYAAPATGSETSSPTTVSLTKVGSSYVLAGASLDAAIPQAGVPFPPTVNTLSLTFPDTPTTTTGQVSGDTVSWDLTALTDSTTGLVPSIDATAPTTSPAPVPTHVAVTGALHRLGKGRLHVGGVVRIAAPAAPAGVTRTIRWYAGSRALPGSRTSRRIARSLAGKRLQVVAAYSRAGYLTTTLTLRLGAVRR